jgi:amino-acid N-acetyltransferase
VIETEIARATAADVPAVRDLLTAAGLPLAGIDAALELALVAHEEGVLLGCAAVERYDPDGMLRSVCVAEDRRGTGLGRTLVEVAEELAREAGITTLYLLTETAIDWFPRFGYVRLSRSEAPPAVASSVEFAEACPDSAVFMAKKL